MTLRMSNREKRFVSNCLFDIYLSLVCSFSNSYLERGSSVVPQHKMKCLFFHTISCTVVFFILMTWSPVHADTNANCTYEDIRGKWIFNMGPGNMNKNINCSGFSAKTQMRVELLYPDVAVDEFDNKGYWTLIYNQGFEVVIAGRKYFAFSKYVGKKSFCDLTMPGMSHDLLGRDWACYTGTKMTKVPVKIDLQPKDAFPLFAHMINSDEMVDFINSRQTSWIATKYKKWEGKNYEDIVRISGGRRSRIANRPRASLLTKDQKMVLESLPDHFDWRDIDGQNFVSPIRNQGNCGSCYSFASMAMNEARVKILTNNTQAPVFSPQDVVECSPYSQGCEGGFPYLVGGKYAEDYGLVEEKWNPYTGKDGPCRTDPLALRHYSTKYRYLGGFYGASNEAVMMQALYESGPIAVSFEVYKDFLSYKSGIYHHTTNHGVDGFNPFELTNHVVLIVGWGRDRNTGEKYWIVKNSWGEDWGQQGYFWISRGNDECAIESIAVESFPILTFNP